MPGLPMTNNTYAAPKPMDASSYDDKPRLQALLFNILTVLLAAATLLVACLHLMHRRRENRKGREQAITDPVVLEDAQASREVMGVYRKYSNVDKPIGGGDTARSIGGGTG